ncbi:uncharacterized protein METZ01_LOCUS328782 [marine metagenome]|uniref:Uncharacterized protein n=1 Tax=marine metagenome TaxID=408172 RepID=A0A382PTG5_9ZZZZ
MTKQKEKLFKQGALISVVRPERSDKS